MDFTARHPVVVNHRIAGTELRPMRIVVLSDVHAGGWWMTRKILADLIDRSNEQQPDLAIFAGDAIADRALPFRTLSLTVIAEEIARFEAPLGTFAVLGNHDWKDDPVGRKSGFRTCRAWTALEAAGVPVLDNRSVELGGTWLVGVDSRRARAPLDMPGLDDPDAAFAGVPNGSPAILVAHEPDIFAEDARATLQISGHTHGGQIAPFGWTPRIPSDYGSRYAWGHIVEAGRHLVVSGGAGFVLFPLRVGRPPEITVIDIGERNT